MTTPNDIIWHNPADVVAINGLPFVRGSALIEDVEGAIQAAAVAMKHAAPEARVLEEERLVRDVGLLGFGDDAVGSLVASVRKLFGNVVQLRPSPPEPPPPDDSDAPWDADPPDNVAAPLLFDRQALPPFPVDALPEWLGTMANEVARETETPVDLAAMLGLGVLSTACARRVAVSPKAGYVEPLNLYLLVALNSGNRKSAVFRRMTDVVTQVERELVAAAAPAVEAQRAANDVLKEQLEAAKKLVQRSKGEEQIAARLDMERLATEVAQAPPAVAPRLLAQDVTSEKLAMMLAEHGRIAVLDDEGGLFETIAGRYSRAGTSNVDALLKGHDGGEIRVSRVGRPDFTARRPALTMAMAVQEDVLRGLGDKQGFRGRGFIARFLFSLPKSLMGSRTHATEAAADAVVNEYERRVRAVFDLPDAGDMPPVVFFSPEARAAWHAYVVSMEPRKGPRGDLAQMVDWASKLEGAVVRIAGLFHVADHPMRPNECHVAEDAVCRAVAVGAYLLEHARAALSELGLDEDGDRARRLVEWIRAGTRRTFTLRDVQHSNALGRQKAADIEPILEILVQRRIVSERAGRAPGPKGGRPSGTTYVVHPAVLQ